MAGVEGRVAVVTGSVAGTKTVLEAQAPAFSVQQAEVIARQAFDIQASAHPLASERDLDHFDAQVLPQLKMQRAQVIHNDVSGLNTLVDESDLAVPIAELTREHPDPIAAAAEITAGYYAVTALEDDDR